MTHKNFIMEPPIIDNRIVKDKTFAIRLLNFIKDVKVNDCASEEEQQYLIYVAEELLQYQIEIVKDKDEIIYLKNNNLM